MYELSLFSGVGGGLLATKWLLGWHCIGYVEINQYCCKVLEQRIKDGFLDEAPIWQMDIGEFNRRIAPLYKGVVDVITAGFPCQPFSSAGRKKGPDDPRDEWSNTIETVRLLRPQFVYLENVTNILVYIGRIFSDLAQVGYYIRWDCLPAHAVGAPHYRDRTWIIAYSKQA